MDIVKIIIVGNGERAGCYMKYLNGHDDLKVVAVIDPDRRKQREAVI